MDNSHDLEKFAQRNKEYLVKVTTVFPFTLFPDTLVIDRQKITLARRQFFGTADIASIQIEDILNVVAHVGPFLGSIDIYTKFYSKKPLKVNYLSRLDALNVKRILQGYIAALNEGIKCSDLSKNELLKLLYTIGKGSSN